MRILHVLNNNWPLLFEVTTLAVLWDSLSLQGRGGDCLTDCFLLIYVQSNQSSSLVSNSEFMNAKLSAKILRQLQGNAPINTLL